MGILGDKIAAAQEAKSNDITTFVWKGPKKEVNGKLVQEEVRLKDATEEQLKKFLAHCNSMLYSKDKDKSKERVSKIFISAGYSNHFN